MKIKLEKALAFMNSADAWLKQSDNHRNSPIAKCMFKMFPQIEEAAKPLAELIEQHNKELEAIKNEHATEVVVTEHSVMNNGRPQLNSMSCEYRYTKESIKQRNLDLNAKIESFKKAEDEYYAGEVDLEVHYTDVRPSKQIFPEALEKLCIGIVIDPEHDKPKIELVK